MGRVYGLRQNMAAKAKLPCDDVSDGEISSDEEDSAEEMQDETQDDSEVEEMEQPSEEEEDDDDSSDWTLVTKGPAARKRKNSSPVEVKKKKKKRKRAPEIDPPVSAVHDSTVSDSSPNSYLTNDQKTLLRVICNLVKKLEEPENKNFKTVDFQAVMRHLVLNDPGVPKAKMKRAKDLRKKRVLVIWLSCVGEHEYNASTDHFRGLKSLKLPRVDFSITHPGTEKFVKMGLEAFLEMDILTKADAASTTITPLKEFGKIHCLLSMNDLALNEYPVPTLNEENGMNSLPQGFFQIVTAWPDGNEYSDEVSSYPMFSIDCEMVETDDGKDALAQISVIDENLVCIYSELVKPSLPIKDYRTKYSGITEEKMKDVTLTLEEVQQKLKQLLPSNCILIGHSLECDLGVIKLCHPYVIDTSVLFCPNVKNKSKPGLKYVAKKLLSLDIQCGNSGHNPTEDATACMRLVQKKIKDGPKLVIPWRGNRTSLFNLFHQHSRAVAMVDKQSIVNTFAKGVPDCVAVRSDEEAVEQASESTIDTQFCFVQLHCIEQFRKECDEAEAQVNKDTYKKQIDSVDSDVCELVNSCCRGTLIFVVCGSGYITKVRKLQKAESTNMAALKEEVKKARTGHVVALLK